MINPGKVTGAVLWSRAMPFSNFLQETQIVQILDCLSNHVKRAIDAEAVANVLERHPHMMNSTINAFVSEGVVTGWEDVRCYDSPGRERKVFVVGERCVRRIQGFSAD